MAQSFELLATKSLGGDISCMEWCPTMDLLALVTADSQLMVHRRPVRQGAEFHKLFTHAGFDHPVTCLVWRPDGQVLAVGHADGSISLFGVEEGEQIGHAHEHSEALCLFRWVAASADDDDASAPDYSCSLVGIFPPLPQLAKQGSVQQYLCEEGTPPLDATLYRLLFEPHASLFFDIAVTTDTAARVHLAVHGRFSLGCVPIAELSSGALNFGGSTPSLLAVQLASSLHALTVVARTSAPSHALLPDGTWQEQPAGTLLLAFRTGQLTRARREIRALALSFMQCKALASRAKEGLHAAQRLWQEAVSPLHTKMASLAAKLQDTRGLKTVSEQLAVLLAAGVPSPLLQAFFSTELRETELTRALKCLGVAASALTQLCLMHVHPALEILIQRLSHLEGLSKWPFHFAALGLQPPRVAAALEAAASLRASAELLLVAVRRTTPELCAFLGWLVRMVRKVRDEPPPTAEEMPPPKIKVVAAFLLASRSRVGGLPYDQVNDLFAEYDSAQGTEGAAPPPPLLAPEDDDALSRLAPLPVTCRLPVAIVSLESMLDECFSPVAHHVSAGFQLHSCTPIDAASAAEIEAAARPDSSRSAPLLIEVLQPEPQVTVASKVGTGASGRAAETASRQLLMLVMPRPGASASVLSEAGVQLALFRARWALQDADSPSWEAAAFGGAEATLVHAAFYCKDDNKQLALLLRADKAGTTLALRSLSDVTFAPLLPGAERAASLSERIANAVLLGMLPLQPLCQDGERGVRARTFKRTEPSQLALSHKHGRKGGMAALLTKARRTAAPPHSTGVDRGAGMSR